MIIDYKSGKYYVGAEFKTKQGCLFKIIGKSLSKKDYFWIEFQDEYKAKRMVARTQILNNNAKNPYFPSICGVAFVGEGYVIDPYINGEKSMCFSKFKSMIERCYNPSSLAYNNYAYKDVTVCNDWLNYSIFSKWFKDNYIEGYEIDKDILQRGVVKKIYSPSTCHFIPSNENKIESLKNRDNSNRRMRDISIHEKTPIRRYNFKLLCKKRGISFDMFKEEFSGWYVKKNGSKDKTFTYILKE